MEYLIKSVQKSWDRILKISLGTLAPDWCTVVEETMGNEIEKFKNDVNSFVIIRSIKTLPHLDFTSGPQTQIPLN